MTTIPSHKESDDAHQKSGHWHLLRSLFKELSHQFLLFPQKSYLLFFTLLLSKLPIASKIHQIRFLLLTISALAVIYYTWKQLIVTNS